MNEKSRKKGILQFITMPMWLCIVFVACSLVFLVYMVMKNEHDNKEYLQNAAKQIHMSVIKQIEGDMQTLEGLSVGLGSLGVTDGGQIMRMLQNINDENAFIRMGYADLEGNLDLVDIGGEHHQVNVAEREFFQRALQGEEAISEAFLDSFQEDAYVNYYGVPMRDPQGKLTGVLCAVHGSQILREIIDTPLLKNQGYSDIVDGDGRFILRSIASMEANAQEDMEQIVQGMMACGGTDSSFTFKSGEGESCMAVLLPLPSEGWRLFSAIPLKTLRARYLETAVGIMVIIVVACALLILLLIRQRKMVVRNQEKLMRLAYEDGLTGIRNFDGLKRTASELFAARNPATFIMWYCDVKNFKFLNDVLGYENGDYLLKELAGFFQETQGEDGVVCRVAGDNFAGIRPFCGREEIDGWFSLLMDKMASVRERMQSNLFQDICMGIYQIREEDQNLSVDVMMNYANMARRSVKGFSGSNYAFYDDGMRKLVIEEAALEARVDQAFRNGEFQVYLQPKVNIQNGDYISGAEALARWQSPEEGLISPARFIPVLEKNERIVELDRYIFERVCRWFSRYLKEGRTPLNIAVNVSKIGLMKMDFVEYYGSVKEAYGIPDGMLELEFTESILMNDMDIFVELVDELKKRGFICSMDDFGSGYSSLNLLKDLPIQVLKLDVLFFRSSRDLKRERIVVSNFIRMTKELEIKTIAEGVETIDSVEFLRRAGCDVIQGYIFAKPMPLDDFETLVTDLDGSAMEMKEKID